MPERYHKNVPGPFYVGNGECISCGAPEAMAPDLMTHDTGEDGLYGHCYFKRQPVTAAEWERAFRAFNISCCGAVYFTEDPSDAPEQVRPQFEAAMQTLRENWKLSAQDPVQLAAIERQAAHEARIGAVYAILQLVAILGGFAALYFIIDFLMR